MEQGRTEIPVLPLRFSNGKSVSTDLTLEPLERHGVCRKTVYSPKPRLLPSPEYVFPGHPQIPSQELYNDRLSQSRRVHSAGGERGVGRRQKRS